jgi:type VI secretion system secreted protein VgrG
MTVPEIVKKVFDDHKPADFDDKLTGTYRKWDFCVQYRETDFNFVSRLLEQEGIYYYFKHDDGHHTMVLADAPSCHDPFPGFDEIPFRDDNDDSGDDTDSVTGWEFASTIQPGVYAQDDFDFERPSVELLVKKTHSQQHELADYELYDFPGEYLQKPDGEQYAAARIEELAAQFEIAQATTNARGLASGCTFKLAEHPRDDQNREYLVLSASYTLEYNEYETMPDSAVTGYSCQFECMTSRQQFRPQRITPKPSVQGPQTAVVVGPSGEEIYTDKYGRIKVQFHWDRYGKKDENSSCWMRVSQPWAGKGWGAMMIPRVGQEVIVDFLEGDPDEPIVTGRVYNAEQMPPWALPDNKTQSGVLTRSSKSGSAGNANAIRFEDKKGSEQLWIHAERNQDIEVEADESHWVGHDRTKKVDHDETTKVGNNRTETVGKDETITIAGNRTEQVGGNECVTVSGSRDVTIGNHDTLTVANNETITIGGSQTETIAQAATQTVGGAMLQTIGGTLTQTVAGAITVTTPQAMSITATAGLNITAPAGINLLGGTAINSVGGNWSWVKAYNLQATGVVLDIAGSQNEVRMSLATVAVLKREAYGVSIAVAAVGMSKNAVELDQGGVEVKQKALQVVG